MVKDITVAKRLLVGEIIDQVLADVIWQFL